MKIDKTKFDLAMANKVYSMGELSKQCNVSRATIAKIAKGNYEAKPETVGKIAKALEVSPIDLVE